MYLARGPTQSPRGSAEARKWSGDLLGVLVYGVWGIGRDHSGAILDLCGGSLSRTCRRCCRQLSLAGTLSGARTGLDRVRGSGSESGSDQGLF